MAKPSLVIVLAEDGRHQNFVRRYLTKRGYRRHEIRFVELPSGRGCGEQWVRARYATAVRDCRRRQAVTALIVAIDSDTVEVARRSQQLEAALLEADLHARGREEKIVHLIPKRTIETWILCLHGEQVNEESDYRLRRDVDQKIGAAAITFFEWSRPTAMIPLQCVLSLVAAVPEVRRLDS